MPLYISGTTWATWATPNSPTSILYPRYILINTCGKGVSTGDSTTHRSKQMKTHTTLAYEEDSDKGTGNGGERGGNVIAPAPFHVDNGLAQAEATFTWIPRRSPSEVVVLATPAQLYSKES